MTQFSNMKVGSDFSWVGSDFSRVESHFRGYGQIYLGYGEAIPPGVHTKNTAFLYNEINEFNKRLIL